MILRFWVAHAGVAAVCLAAAPAPAPVPAPPAEQPPPPAVLAGPAPTETTIGQLVGGDPIPFFEACVRRVKADVHGYRATLVKQERIRGKLGPREVIRVTGRAEPYSVRMVWQEGARETLGTKTEGTLFVAGENGGKIKVWRPSAFLAAMRFMDVAPTDDRARDSSRYAITEGGLLSANERTYRAWSEALALDPAAWPKRWKFHGTQAIAEVGGRTCHVYERACDPPEVDRFVRTDPAPDVKARAADAFAAVKVMIDAETYLQVGSELRRTDGELIGSYFFRDVELNPKIPADQFTVAAFKK